MNRRTQPRSAGTRGSATGLSPRLPAHHAQRGAAMLAAMCFASVLTIALGSYMTVCYRTLEMSSRTVQSAGAVQLAEAGMEDAIWTLNKNDWSTWTITGTTATKTIGGFSFDNNVTGSVNLTITNYDGSGGTRTITVSGTSQAPNAASVTRTLTATSAKAPLFVNAVAATTGRVKFRNAGTVDSYDSTLGTYASQTPTYSAILSSGSTSTSSATVQLANAQVKGYVATLGTGPSYSSSAKLIGPTTPAATKIDPARTSTSPYQPSFGELAPAGTSTLLPAGTATIGTAGATSPSLYHATDVDLNGSKVLTVDGPVTLTISGDLEISNNAKIRITTNGSLEIHLAGDLSIEGDGIQNDTLLPRKLAILGTDDNDHALEMNTDQPFHGVIYTPEASLTIGNSQTIHGAFIADAVTFSASPAFHYDLSLRSAVFAGIETPYAVSDWRETTAGN